MTILKKNIFIIFLILVVAISFSGCGGNNPSPSTSTNTKSTEAKPEKKTYKFNNEQIAFLKSIGIKEMNDIEVKDGLVTFYYDKEEIAVSLNEKNGITEVFNCKWGTSDRKTLWNDKKGKIGMLRADKLALLDNFIDTHPQKYDQANQVTWVDSSGPYPLGHKGVFTYMGIRGREKSGQKWLRATIHYSGGDWVFFNRVVFSNTKDTWTYHVPKTPTHQVVMGGVHEYIDVPFEDLQRGMDIIAYGDNPKIDFYGNDYRAEKLCTSHEVDNAKTYLFLLEAINL